MVKYNLDLNWKSFNVFLPKISSWVTTLVGIVYCGCSASDKLTLHFLEEPSEETLTLIKGHWDSLTETSEEALAYKSAEEERAAKVGAKEAAKAKLTALGLSEEEIQALFT